MKSPEMSNQERQNDNPISRVESNPRVDKLKKDLKFSFWDFQAKNGMKASVVDFANDPSFAQCLNEAKRSGLSMEEMGIAVEFIRDTYGKKVVAQQDHVKISSVYEKYDVNNDIGTKNNNHREAETRERNILQPEADILHDTERKKQIEIVEGSIEKEFSLLARKFYVKMKEERYTELTGSPELTPSELHRYNNYMNTVYNDTRNFLPSEDDLLFSIRDSTLVCTPGRSVEKNDLMTFDLDDLDDSSRATVLLDIKNKWKAFVSSSRK